MENNSYSSSSSYSDPHSHSSHFVNPSPSILGEEQGESWNIQKFISIVKRRGLLIAGITITAMIIIVFNLKLNRKPAEYEGSFQLLVEPVNDDTKTVDLLKEASSTQTSLDYDTQIQVLRSPEILRKTVKQLQVIDKNINYSSLINSLSINRLGETKIIEIRYRSTNPHEIQLVLKLIANDYLEYSQERRETKLKQGAKFVDQQLKLVRKRVNQIQNDLQFFRQKHDFNSPEIETEEVNEQIKKLYEQRRNLDIQLAIAGTNLNNLQSIDGQSAALNNANLYQQLLIKLQELDTQISIESTRLQNENPSLQALKEKRASLLPVLQKESKRILSVKTAELVTQIKTLQLQKNKITETEQKLEQRRSKLPIFSKRYTEIQNELQIANDSLNRFLSIRENLQVQISQSEMVWQLLKAPTQPDTPISTSSTRRNLISGLFASLLIGFGIALLIEKIDKTYHNVDTLKEKVNLPLLGNIPFEKQIHINQIHALKSRKIIKIPSNHINNSDVSTILEEQYDNKYSKNFLESLRLLFTNIQLLTSDRHIRSIAISSAMHGDGKSTIAFHLAQIATAMGQRVLLVDADLRQPMIHVLSGLNNSLGLSNLITTNLPVVEVIHQLPAVGQLSVITSGPLPPDPPKLLSSERIKQLMEDFHNSFDLVIYDLPPLVGLADANLIAHHTDGILMVVKIDKTDSIILQKALDNLKISRLSVLGIVGNGQSHDFTF